MKHVYYAVILVVRPQGEGYQLLMARRVEGRYMGGTWQLIAGGLQPGEPAWQAALRELREETGLQPVEFYRLSSVTGFYRYENDSLNTAVMFCALVHPEATVTINDEHTEFAWVDLEAAEKRLMWPSDRQALGEVRHMILGGEPAKEYLRIPLEDLQGM